MYFCSHAERSIAAEWHAESVPRLARTHACNNFFEDRSEMRDEVELTKIKENEDQSQLKNNLLRECERNKKLHSD